ENLSKVIQELLGLTPYKWQLDLAQKVLQGFDCIGVAGTGSGKSLVYAMLAKAMEITETK
ncbi:hypothetical protein FA15DRAFT_546315, partial [Coprinopsis marcescibilis]